MVGGWVLIAAGVFAFAPGCGSGDEPAEETGSSKTPPASRAAPDTARADTAPDPRLEDIAFLRAQPPSLELDLALGSYFLKRGEDDSALVHYRDGTERDPQSPRAWNFVGITLGRMGRLDEAVAAYRTAIERDPFYVKTHINLGNVLLRQDNVDEAINAYRTATRVDSTDFLAWYNLGLAYERKTGERTGPVSSETDKEAIKAYNKAIKCDDSRAEPWERMGWIFFDQKFYTAARLRWIEAVKRDPTLEDLRENIESLQAFTDSTGIQ